MPEQLVVPEGQLACIILVSEQLHVIEQDASGEDTPPNLRLLSSILLVYIFPIAYNRNHAIQKNCT